MIYRKVLSIRAINVDIFVVSFFILVLNELVNKILDFILLSATFHQYPSITHGAFLSTYAIKHMYKRLTIELTNYSICS
jgi:hypothetical protein